uniref:Cyclin A n=1 Tax=Rhipicephalus appendiculatus TaxID=34631 RepID=A0A131Z080_RHIAP
MARRNATVGYADENSRPLNLNPKITGNAEKASMPAIPKRQALGCIQTNRVAEKKPLAKRDCGNQQNIALRRSARLGATAAENSRPTGRFEVFDDASCGASDQPHATLPVEAASAREPISLAVPAASENSMVVPMSPDCRMEDEAPGESPMVLDTSLHTLEPMTYSDVREQESSAEYAKDICAYMKELEVRLACKANYMKKQPDITATMRTILVDWLVEVAEEYQLHNETLFLAVSYVDRFLSSMSVQRTRLQLVGTASLLIAAKFEEIYPPEVTEFVYITDDTYTKQQVLKMEQVVLKVLCFDVAAPTSYAFLLRFAEVSKCPDTVTYLAQYLCELALMDDDPYLQYLPSIIAGAALCLANHTLNRHPWGQDLVDFSGYEVHVFRECIHSLYSTFCNASSREQKAVHEKFKHSKFNAVAHLKPSQMLPF